MTTDRTKLRWGAVVYAALAVCAGLTLTGAMRIAIWVLLAGLAVKTWIGVLRDRV